MKLLDSFAWIEYFMGSRRGVRVRDYVEGDVYLYTPSICIIEIKSKYLREQKDPETRIKLVEERSFIVPLDIDIALLAADLKVRHGLHTVDAIVYATAQHKSLTLVTGDHHFKDLPDVEMI